MFPYAEADGPVEWGDVTLALALANALVFLAQRSGLLGAPDMLLFHLGFIPARPVWYTWLTSQFLHAGFFHVVGNLWALWIFGRRVERRLGGLFPAFYLAGGLCANLLTFLAAPSSPIPSIGASGAIAGVLGLYAVLFPKARLKFWQPFQILPSTYTMSALVFGVIYLFGESSDFFADPSGARTFVAHGAHVGGFMFGLAAGFVLRSRLGSDRTTGGGAIGRALAEGRDQEALDLFTRQLRGAVRPELPDEIALALADKMAAAGHWRLAEAALERLLQDVREPSLAPHVLLLLGYAWQAGLLDLASAVEAFESAAAHPAATQALRADAVGRARNAREAIGSGSSGPVAPEEPAWLILDSRRPLLGEAGDKADREIVAEGLSTKDAAGGILAVNERGAAALSCAARLRKGGILAVAVPARWSSELASAAPVRVVTVAPEGLLLDGARFVRWSECLLVAAYETKVERLVKKGPGLLEISFESAKSSEPEYKGETVTRLALEIVGMPGTGRWRWIVDCEKQEDAEACRALRSAAVSLILAAPAAALNDGVGALALGAALPAHCRFQWSAEAELYLSWRAQLARLRRLPPSSL